MEISKNDLEYRLNMVEDDLSDIKNEMYVSL